jgi:hypothetical protein
LKKPETIALTSDETIAAYLAAYAAAHPSWPKPEITRSGQGFVRIAVFGGPPGTATSIDSLAMETGKLRRLK